MSYYVDPLPNLKSLNLQFRQEINIFYSKRLVTTWSMASSWNLNFEKGFSFDQLLAAQCSAIYVVGKRRFRDSERKNFAGNILQKSKQIIFSKIDVYKFFENLFFNVYRCFLMEIV